MPRQRLFKIALALVAALAALTASAQFQADKVTLYKNLSLSTLGATAGNDCWGYVSPSGREFAFMGCNNRTAFVEVTDPANPVYFAHIPHSSSTWSDIKVYRNHAYIVTEASGTGVQVVDLSNIENHEVTLVRTIAAPGRTHNIHVDEESGFLYTCGSRDGTGTTMCFNLSSPGNPVQVGASTMTPVYQHDVQVKTFTSGPYAGRQIMFGAGEGRGLEIWDVTDKSAPSLIRRVAYPFVGYCHQGWLSSDYKYFYVNDEFDESQNSITTRTLVFDVSVLETADLVATFTSGRPAIDHNLYFKNGFIFEANYRSGLRIFNANGNPTAPVQVGYFDTYPADDLAQFDGAWSNYPFFPSGTVIISDINRGLFIVDVTEATRTKFPVQTATIERGVAAGGDAGKLGASDDDYMTVKRGITSNQTESPISVVMEGTCLWTDITKLSFSLEGKVNTAGLQVTLELYDFVSGGWVQPQSVAGTMTDSTVTVTGTTVDRFIEAGTKKMKARVSVRATGPTALSQWQIAMDNAEWAVNP